MKRNIFITAAVLLTALLLPAFAAGQPDRASDLNGGCSQGPVKSALLGGSLFPGTFPPIGSSYAECWHIGHYPMIGMTTNYWMHARLTWSWAADGWDSNNQGQIWNVRNPHLVKRVVQVWWDHLSDRISYDRSVQVINRKPPCQGCLKIRVVGQVHVDALPYLSIPARTAHPWVEFTIGADGEFMGADYSHAVF